MKMKYITKTREIIETTDKIVGRGGEGQVLPISGKSHLVAKIFNTPTNDRYLKLTVQIANPPPLVKGSNAIAWPIDLLFTHGDNHKFVGYIMPKIEFAHPLYALYSLTIRQEKHFCFNYMYLLRTARNLSSVVSMVHASNYQIGDLNESNVLARSDAAVTLIDADSWQVIDVRNGLVHRCHVGKGDYTPPELQGKNFSALDRHEWHDNFSLAVILYQLLAEGSHPFAGLYRGPGDPPTIEQRIIRGDFPHFNQSGLWASRPVSIPFSSLHTCLQQLFIKAFINGHINPSSRPTAMSWRYALQQAEADLHSCNNNSNHLFWGPTCIWCARKEQLGGIDPFPSPSPTVVQFNRQITHVQPGNSMYPPPVQFIEDLVRWINDLPRKVTQQVGLRTTHLTQAIRRHFNRLTTIAQFKLHQIRAILGYIKQFRAARKQLTIQQKIGNFMFEFLKNVDPSWQATLVQIVAIMVFGGFPFLILLVWVLVSYLK